MNAPHVKKGFDAPQVFDSAQQMRRRGTQLHGSLRRHEASRSEGCPASSSAARLFVSLACFTGACCFGDGG
jgi:hypothetical protein